MHDAELTALRIPRALCDCAREILTIAEDACSAHLDDEYGQLCSHLVARLARKRPSPLVRGDARIWAAGAIYAVGQANFSFDRSQQHALLDDLTVDAYGDEEQLSGLLVGAEASEHRLRCPAGT